jgi:hypothetical protein
MKEEEISQKHKREREMKTRERLWKIGFLKIKISKPYDVRNLMSTFCIF